MERERGIILAANNWSTVVAIHHNITIFAPFKVSVFEKAQISYRKLQI